jgi:hypothetical protein
MIKLVKGYIKSKIEYIKNTYNIKKGDKYRVLCIDSDHTYLAEVPTGWEMSGRNDLLIELQKLGLSISGNTRVFWFYKDGECEFIKNKYGCKNVCDPCLKKCEFFQEG